MNVEIGYTGLNNGNGKMLFERCSPFPVYNLLSHPVDILKSPLIL